MLRQLSCCKEINERKDLSGRRRHGKEDYSYSLQDKKIKEAKNKMIDSRVGDAEIFVARFVHIILRCIRDSSFASEDRQRTRFESKVILCN